MRILVRLVAHRVARCVWRVVFVFVFKQKTAYEMRISDWSSDVCSSDLTYSAESRRSASGPTLISIMFSIKAHRQGGQSLVSPHDIVSSGLCIGCGGCVAGAKIARAHVCTPVTNSHIVCRLLLEHKNQHNSTRKTPPV